MFKTNRISFQVVCKLLSFSMKPTTLRKTQGSFTHLSSMTWWVWKKGVDEEWEWKTSNWPWWDMWRRVIRYNHQTVNFVYSLSKTLKFSSSYFVREKVNHILINLLKVFFFLKNTDLHSLLSFMLLMRFLLYYTMSVGSLDLCNILQLNPASPLSTSDSGYNPSPSPEDRVHVLVCVHTGNATEINSLVLQKMKIIREAASDLGKRGLSV